MARTRKRISPKRGPAPLGQQPPPREKKFIPDADDEFRVRAEKFSAALAREPGGWRIDAEWADHILRLVQRFSDAHQKCCGKGTRTIVAIRERDELRVVVEKEIRSAARLIRADDSISSSDKIVLDIKERATKLKKRLCPKAPPELAYAGSRWGARKDNDGREVHVLEFC